MDVIHHLLPPTDTGECAQNGRNQVLWFPEREISVESFIVGALEATFHEMVTLRSMHYSFADIGLSRQPDPFLFFFS